ncbi:MAG: Signal transduction histidine kinase CheA [Labilithrix sp.]|nr:Signal transduction histidine kinase CheA [Labilithrix sp.]
MEGAWGSLTQRVGTAEAESELFHDVHTLKGEARLVGFADVVLITQRLEDLLVASRRRRYRVTEDVDVLVTMAIQFIRMLVRKRAGASQGGIDINGFLKQIDDVLAEWPRQSETPDASGSTTARPGETGKVSVAVRQRLGAAATQIFLELVTSSDRPRLRRAWEILIGELSQLDAVPLMPLLRRHATSAKEVAAELGKEVDVSIDGPDVKVGIEVLDAIHAALLHTLRNAVDHGIESAEVRSAAGKPRRGSVVVRLRIDADAISVSVQDDGGGIDTESIRRRAEKLGLLSPEDAAAAPDTTLFDLTFAPNFSVREAASTISGRGIGLDAVRAGIERLGGTISIDSKRHVGVTVNFQLPISRRVIDVHRLPSTEPGIAFAVPTTWMARTERRDDSIDPAVALGLRRGGGSVSATLSHIVLARDGEEYPVLIGGSITRVAAVRVCPTSPDEGLEVVAVGDDHLLLIRPDAFFPSLRRSP